MDPVKLEEFAVILPNLLFDVAIPEVRSEAEGVVQLFVHGDVIRAFELDNEIALGFVS